MLVLKQKKPLILSSGMANIDEIKDAIKEAKNNNCKELSLLHCVSGYPTPLDQCNLKAINTLKLLDKKILKLAGQIILKMLMF